MKKLKKKTLYMYKYVQMPTQELKQIHAHAHPHTLIYTNTHTPACCHFGFCAYTGVVLCDRASSASKWKNKKKKRRGVGKSRIIYMHHSLGIGTKGLNAF